MNRRDKIIMVDDVDIYHNLAEHALREKYDVFSALSADSFFSLLDQMTPALILLDITMPHMDGFEIIEQLKKNESTAAIPIIFLTGHSDPDNEIKGLNLGAVDYITKPFSSELLLKRVDMHVLFEKQKREILRRNISLKNEVEDKLKAVVELQSVILSAIAELVERRDPATGGHIDRTQYALNQLINMLVKEDVYVDALADIDIPLLIMSSQLHDVGKIAIKDGILLKKGILSADEFNEMKKHTTYGVEIIKKIVYTSSGSTFLRYAEVFAATHHERWDGKGYPKGLKGEDIPLIGRLMAIVDVYDALVSERPYKSAFSHEVAIETINEGCGTQFDPLICSVFVKNAHMFKKGDELSGYNSSVGFDYHSPLMLSIPNAKEDKPVSEILPANNVQRYFELLFNALFEHDTSEVEHKNWDKDTLLASLLLYNAGELSLADITLTKDGLVTEHQQSDAQFAGTSKSGLEPDIVLLHTEKFAGSHHEKWNGTGQPLGLKGKSIPLEGRLIAIIDVYNSLRTTRPHRKCKTHKETVNLIENGSGTRFDPELVELFLFYEDDFEKISTQ